MSATVLDPRPSDPGDLPPAVPGMGHGWVQVQGCRLHVATAGPADGPVVVLLHGWPQHFWIWRDVVGPLVEAGHRVVAPDLRGQGWSEATELGYSKEQFATDVVGLLDALGLDRVDLVGHDWGGWTAQLVALREPERVRRLGVLSIASVWTPPGTVARHLPRFAYQALVATPRLGPTLQRTAPFWWAMRRAGVPAAEVRTYRDRYRDPRRAEAGSRIYREFLTREVSQLAQGRYGSRRLRMPTLALVGSDDPVIRPEMVQDLRSHGDDVDVVVIDGEGHFLPDTCPELVARHLLRFLGPAGPAA